MLNIYYNKDLKIIWILGQVLGCRIRGKGFGKE
jgi:hypothetical protein